MGLRGASPIFRGQPGPDSPGPWNSCCKAVPLEAGPIRVQPWPHSTRGARLQDRSRVALVELGRSRPNTVEWKIPVSLTKATLESDWCPIFSPFRVPQCARPSQDSRAFPPSVDFRSWGPRVELEEKFQGSSTYRIPVRAKATRKLLQCGAAPGQLRPSPTEGTSSRPRAASIPNLTALDRLNGSSVQPFSSQGPTRKSSQGPGDLVEQVTEGGAGSTTRPASVLMLCRVRITKAPDSGTAPEKPSSRTHGSRVTRCMGGGRTIGERWPQEELEGEQ